MRPEPGSTNLWPTILRLELSAVREAFASRNRSVPAASNDGELETASSVMHDKHVGGLVIAADPFAHQAAQGCELRCRDTAHAGGAESADQQTDRNDARGIAQMMMRVMLYEAAQSMLQSKRWSWLKAWAMQIARRRGRGRSWPWRVDWP